MNDEQLECEFVAKNVTLPCAIETLRGEQLRSNIAVADWNFSQEISATIRALPDLESNTGRELSSENPIGSQHAGNAGEAVLLVQELAEV